MSEKNKLNKGVFFGILIPVLVVLKLLYFYHLMSVHSLLIPVTLISAAVVFLLAAVIRRKWIFGIIYFLISFFMTVDVNYFSYFNRTMSITAFKAAGLLGGVAAAAEEAFFPSSLLIMVDAVVILIYCIISRKEEHGALIGLGERLTSGKKRRLACLLILIVAAGAALIASPEEYSLGSGVVSEEFFTFHVRDIASGGATSSGGEDFSDILVADLNYENEKDGPEFGAGEGMNLIVIQVEAMENFVINRTYNGQEITPFINSLLKDEDTYYFDSYYSQVGSGNTSDAEFATNNSLHGSWQYYTYQLYEDNYWRGLPVLLKELGYSTGEYHGYVSDFWNRENAVTKMGFDRFYSEDDFNVYEALGYGISDRLFFDQSMDYIKKQGKPFYSFLVTLSTHYPFAIEGRFEPKEEDKDTVYGNYIVSMSYFDKALEELFDRLEKEGLADNTIVAFYGDHQGMNPTEEQFYGKMTDLLGYSYDFDTSMNVPLVVYVPGSGEGRTIHTVGGQMDFLPSIAYIMGFDELDTIYLGHNLFTVEDNLVPMRAYVSQGTFLTGDTMMMVNSSSLWSDARAVNIRDHTEISKVGLRDGCVDASRILRTSDAYLKYDVLRQVYEKGRSLEEVVVDIRNGDTDDWE